MIIAYIGIGSNLGNRENNIKNAIELIKESEKIDIISTSSLYETEPEGYEEQGWFLNGAFGLTTDLPPDELLVLLKDVEQTIGREKTIKWGPRKIDLDLLLYDDLCLEKEHLVIPHPRMHQRKFVLVPLAEIAGDVVHPKMGKNINTLLSELETSKIVKEAK